MKQGIAILLALGIIFSMIGCQAAPSADKAKPTQTTATTPTTTPSATKPVQTKPVETQPKENQGTNKPAETDPVKETEDVVAINVNGVVITSSPGPIPAALRAL